MYSYFCYGALVRFFRHPYLYGQVPYSLPEKLKALQISITSLIIAGGIVMGIFVTAYLLGAYTVQDVSNLISPMSTGQNRYLLLSLVLMFSPVVEEVAFRGMFTINKVWSTISVTLFAALVLSFIYQQGFASRWDVSGSTGRIVISGVMLVLWLCLYFQRDYLGSKLKSQTRVFLILSIVAFATIHVFNYDFGSAGNMKVLFIPAIYMLYATFAIALTYVRVKCGLMWAMGMHLASNAAAMMMIAFVG